MLEFGTYQRLAMRTSNKDLTPKEHLINAMLGLSGEVGECTDLVKKHLYQDGRDIRGKLFDEAGDVMWYLAEMANACGFSLDDIAAHNIEKLKKRYPSGFEAERSLHREV